MDMLALRKNLKKDFGGLTKVRLALTGDSSTQILAQALRGWGYERGLDVEVFEAEYNEIDQQLLVRSSALYQSKPEFILLFQGTRRLWERYCDTGPAARGGFAAAQAARLRQHLDAVAQGPGCPVIVCNFPEMDDAVFGHHANLVEGSFLSQVRRLNVGLMDLARATPGLHILDLALLQARFGAQAVIDPKLAVTADFAFTLDFWPEVARAALRIMEALRGRVRKALILDLDNTLWGGILGDDGLEGIQVGHLGAGRAFSDLQRWARELRRRGVLLAVCSKNDEDRAREAFERHPEMVLRLDDFAAFQANWESKVENIRRIQQTLNISLDSLVFVDDSPFERSLVRAQLPEVEVPELPEDPAGFLPTLQALDLFETAAVTEEDGLRTAQYQAEAQRSARRAAFASEDDFLASLAMRATLGPFTDFAVPRLAQLTQRTNQFNLRTVRYTESDIRRLAVSPDHRTLQIFLRDELGDHGLISAVIAEKRHGEYYIDTWLMSCRVLNRGVELLALNALVRLARQDGVAVIRGEYLPTPKNNLVATLLPRLGFTPAEGGWTLAVAGYQDLQTRIILDQEAP